MQEASRIMSQGTDGEVAGVVNSHDDKDHVHGTIRRVAEADSEKDEVHGGGQEPIFFQCLDQEQPPDPVHLEDARVEFPSDEDGDGDDVRVSFATADGDRLLEEQAELDLDVEEEQEDTSRYDYVTWMAPEPVSIHERRRRLLQGMGLTSSKDLLRSRNARARLPPDIPRYVPRRQQQLPAAEAPSTTRAAPAVAAALPEFAEHHPNDAVLTRSCSDSRLVVRGGGVRKMQPFRRVCSLPHSLQGSPAHKALSAAARCPLSSAPSKDGGTSKTTAGDTGGGGFRNPNNDREFQANSQLNSAQRSAPLNKDELEQFISHAPLVTQPVRRSQSQPVPGAGTAKGDEKPAEKRRTRWLRNIKLVASAAGLRNDKDGGGGSRSARTPSVTMSKSASTTAAMSSAATGPERLKVHHYGKSSRELTGLYMRQEVRAHEGSIWSIKFSPDGRFLASGGEDSVVRVWEVLDVDASSSAVAHEMEMSTSLPPQPPPASTDGGRSVAAPWLAAQLSRKVRRGRSSKDALPEHVIVPESVFALAEQPSCALEGHQDDVLDLSWSKSQLLSSSMDHTVRLWNVDTKTCLRVFPHSDYVTCVQFNPADDGYFISGSLDCKVRIWSVPDRQVVDWSDLNDMVTAACYTPDGQAAIIGSHRGSCRFYKTTDCKLNQEAQIDMSITKKRRSQAKKITGFHFAPGNPSEILVTSADSQIRVFNGISVLQKFKGTHEWRQSHDPAFPSTHQELHAQTPQPKREPVFLPARLQEHQQPDLGVLHRRRPLRRVRQRGLQRLRVAPRPRQRRRHGRCQHQRQGQDVAHQPVLRVLLLPRRVCGRAVARFAVHPVRRVPARQRQRQQRHAQETDLVAPRRRRRWRWLRTAGDHVRDDGVPWGAVVAAGAVPS
uniref:WD repeat-containing protein 44 n=1 Tax=Zea mays TaxID=4577 RepID=A0A804P195_MAIZE